MRMIRSFGAAVLAGMMAAGAASAQDYPAQTIKLIVPFIAGGPVDALARVVALHLQNRVGQNVIVENRSGGGTTIGAKAVAAAAPDGYTLLVVGPNIAYYPVLFPNLDFEPAKALAPVATLVTWSHLIAVAPSVPANTIPELVRYVKANPGKLAFGFGLATMPHIIGETFKRAAGIDIIDVPYRGGEQARADLLGGRVHITSHPCRSCCSSFATARSGRWPTLGRSAAPICPRFPPWRRAAIRRSASIPTSGWEFWRRPARRQP